MQQLYNVQEAKTHFSKLLNSVQKGEEVVIGKAGKPVAKIVPLKTEKKKKIVRKPGGWKGKIWVADDFDAPDPELEALFYEGEIEP